MLSVVAKSFWLRANLCLIVISVGLESLHTHLRVSIPPIILFYLLSRILVRNPGLETYKRICGGQKTRKKTAIVALARKLLVRCWAMLRDRKPWRVDLVQAAAS